MKVLISHEDGTTDEYTNVSAVTSSGHTGSVILTVGSEDNPETIELEGVTATTATED